jgi:hypothetical protein
LIQPIQRKAVLTIYKGEAKTEVEKITLSDYNDTERLHKLFAEKGFTKYTEDELDVNRQEEMPKHFAHLEWNKRPAEVGKAQQNFKTAKERLEKSREKLKKLKMARENFMMDASYVTP